MVRCHEMSQISPTTIDADATSTAYSGHSSASAVLRSEARESITGENGTAMTHLASVYCPVRTAPLGNLPGISATT